MLIHYSCLKMILRLRRLKRLNKEKYSLFSHHQNSVMSKRAEEVFRRRESVKEAFRGSNSPKPSANSKRSYVSYTISEDYTGDETSVKRARLAPLAEKQKSSITAESFGGERSLMERPLSLRSDASTKKSTRINQRREIANKPLLSLVLDCNGKPPVSRQDLARALR